MRPISRILLSFAAVLGISQGVFACDQSFNGTLRYGTAVQFTDSFNNSTAGSVGISSVATQFSGFDASGDGATPNFGWTSSFAAGNYIVRPGQTNVPVVESSNYSINYHPANRSAAAINVVYNASYYLGDAAGSTWDGGGHTHSECVSYQITWCGDGVKDPEEQCDNGAANGTPGNSCSAACTINPSSSSSSSSSSSGGGLPSCLSL